MALMNLKLRLLLLVAALLLAACGGNEREAADDAGPGDDAVAPSEPAAPSEPEAPEAPPSEPPSEPPEQDPPAPDPEPEPLPQVGLSVTPEQGEAPLTLTLQWSSTNAQHCAAEGSIWSGGLALEGETEFRLDEPGSYDFAVVCGNDRGEWRAETMVEVTDPFAEARQLYERRQQQLRAADVM